MAYDKFNPSPYGFSQAGLKYRLHEISEQMKKLEQEKRELENKISVIQKQRSQAKQYAIWYAQSSEDEFMPASGNPKFPVKVVYGSLPEAKEVAENLARRYMKTIFKVYPVNQNYEINGPALETYYHFELFGREFYNKPSTPIRWRRYR